jgi:UPF0716 protein FxsA
MRQQQLAGFRKRICPRLRRLLPLFVILVLPLMEIAGFVLVGRQIGVLATIGLVVLAMIVGSVLMRLQGLGVLTRMRRDFDVGQTPGRELAHGAMILLAGALLIVPGFLTDIAGLLLFLPPVRDVVWRFLRSRVQVSSFSSFGGGFARRPDRGPTIDLDADDYSPGPDPDSPWRPIDRR